MAFAVVWDAVGAHKFERGLDRGMIYLQSSTGAYDLGQVWNGLTSVTLGQNNTDFDPIYYDGYKVSDVFNKGYLSGSISAYSYPPYVTYAEGGDDIPNGITVNGQNFSRFALSYRTLNHTDLNETSGYKIHILYNLVAQRTSKDFSSINDSSDAYEFTWDFSCTPQFAGTVSGVSLKPTSHVVIDSTQVSANVLLNAENLLYGISGAVVPIAPLIPALTALT